MEEAIGNETKLLNTAIGKKLQQITEKRNLGGKESTIKMACAKAVIFDYIGTLVNCKGYSYGCLDRKTVQRTGC